MNPSEIWRLSESTRQSVDSRNTKRTIDWMITENHPEKLHSCWFTWIPLKFAGLSEFINQNCKESINTIFTDLSRLTQEYSSLSPHMNPSEIRRTTRITKSNIHRIVVETTQRHKKKIQKLINKKKAVSAHEPNSNRRTVGIHKSNCRHKRNRVISTGSSRAIQNKKKKKKRKYLFILHEYLQN